jgi:hypothetical protein
MRRDTSEWMGRRRWVWAAVTGITLVTALLAGCGGASGATAAGQARPTATTKAVQAKATATKVSKAAKPTATAKPTPTVHIVTLTGATLGGTAGGFTKVYGPRAGQGTWAAKGLTISVNFALGPDGQLHAFEMKVNKFDGSAWTDAQARAACAPLVPPDAKEQGETENDNGDPEVLYTSKLFAASFVEGNPYVDAQGTATISYVTGPTGVFECEFEPYVQ